MKQTGRIKLRRRRRPDVGDWGMLREAVVRRDIGVLMVHFRTLYGWEKLDATYTNHLNLKLEAPVAVCVASMVDPDEMGKCEGRWTLNHVQDPGNPMYGRKVPDEPRYLVSLCWWHHQGSKAGHVWATASENINLQWEYLKEHHDDQPAGDRPDA